MDKFKYKTPSAIIVNGFLVLLSITLVILVIVITRPNKSLDISSPPLEIKDTLQFKDSILNELYNLRVQHPYIVYAQAIVESNNFSSKIFRENNNMFGMKMPNSRTTTALGIRFGYAYYSNWRDCLLDYALYQCIYFRNLTEEEYFKKLASIYAEDLEYIRKVKQIKDKLISR